MQPLRLDSGELLDACACESRKTSFSRPWLRDFAATGVTPASAHASDGVLSKRSAVNGTFWTGTK